MAQQPVQRHELVESYAIPGVEWQPRDQEQLPATNLPTPRTHSSYPLLTDSLASTDGTRNIDNQNDASLAWAQPPTSKPRGIRRGMKRRIKLVKGVVLRALYPIPSAIQNAIQAKYQALEDDQGEFTHMSCATSPGFMALFPC